MKGAYLMSAIGVRPPSVGRPRTGLPSGARRCKPSFAGPQAVHVDLGSAMILGERTNHRSHPCRLEERYCWSRDNT